MKKLFLILSVATLLISCDCENEKRKEVNIYLNTDVRKYILPFHDDNNYSIIEIGNERFLFVESRSSYPIAITKMQNKNESDLK